MEQLITDIKNKPYKFLDQIRLDYICYLEQGAYKKHMLVNYVWV